MKTSIDRELAQLSGKKLLCAVSGGADSMCLLHLLWTAGLDVTAAHFEHGIRGEESLRDERFVRDFCRAYGIPFVSDRGDVPGYAARRGLGIEQAARELRYAFLEKAAEDTGADLILTAHTKDDNAETLLFNLVRGSGTAGLAGIPKRRGKILRPLLEMSRAEVEAYLAAHEVAHVEDSSNREDAYTRNLLRHRVIPQLRKLNPGFAEAARRTALLADRDEDCLSALAAEWLARERGEDGLNLEKLRALHPALASRVLRQLIPGLDMANTESVLNFIQGSEYALLDLPGRTIRREQGRLFLDRGAERLLPPRRLKPGESLELPEAGLRMETEIVVYRGEIHDLFKTSYLKYEIVFPDLLCTGRLPGDSVRPLGRGCTKKLSAIFKEAGYTRAQRDLTPVVRSVGGKALLVRGLALEESACPRPGEKALKIRFSEL